MNNILKDKFFNKVIENFRVMSTVMMKQLELVKKLLDEDNDDTDVYQEIYNNELIIDSLDVKLRREVINAIVLYNPRATDLRQMMSNYDMIGYVERVGDLVLNIARFLKGMDKKSEICTHYHDKILKLVNLSASMAEQSILAYNYENNAMARETINNDDMVDDLYGEICRSTSTDFGGKVLSESQLNDIQGVNGIAYNLERISDNATNIAEAAIYFAEGKDIKHTKLKKEEEDAAATESKKEEA